MDKHSGIQVYSVGTDFVLAKSIEDAIEFANRNHSEKPEQLSKEIYLSEKFMDYLVTLNVGEVEERNALKDWGLYKIDTPELELFREPIPSRFVNARDPSDALNALQHLHININRSPEPTFVNYPTYTIKNLALETQYTGKALQTLVQDIFASKNE